MTDQYGNNVDGEVWVPAHTHFSRDIRPPGYCLACDEYHDRSMGVKPLSEYRNACPDCNGHTFQHEEGCINS